MFEMRPFCLVLVVCCWVMPHVDGTIQDGDYDEKLTEHLFRHSKSRRPVLSIKDNVTVVFGVTLNQIIDVVERNQILKLSLFIRQVWVNPLLRWNVSDYGGITEINIDADKLWKPDIYLYNNADEDKDGAQDRMKTKIKVNHNGTNTWLAPTILQSSCKINVRYFPFDEQACSLKFGSWTYDAWRVDIVAESPTADTKTTQVNGEWDLLSFPCKRNVDKYECCPEPYSDVTCTLKIRRRTTYFFVNLIVPCFLITLLSLLSFFLPSEAGERITLVITNMLALTVFMLIVADILPQTSEVVPLISVYFTSILIEVGLSLIATVVVLKCYFTNPAFSEVPFWIRCVVIQGLGKLLKIEVKRKQHQTRKKENSADEQKKKARPRSMTDSLDPKFNFYHENFSSRRNTEANINLAESSNIPKCGACHDLTVDMLHLGHGLNSRNLSRVPSRTSLRRESWCENPIYEKDLNVNAQSQNSLISALLHQQEHLVSYVRKLVRAVEEQDEHDAKREEWVLVAEILDNFFLYLFVIVMIGSTVMIFSAGTSW
ncbi:neuronal acetylcholine receptor subunit alpha-3-like [Orbicella faveolata]|uniref:neuronal acetylcholine receptor subunit alpha-3-like n=1 Tax=Orbicella faveolata TaxID=48498 RepID=UPI0009E1934C|nr:neuronal acetylcholine receptor subunit alpha-3-like [Orbicella faveolata]XP_020610883.1 neuronal acetylcholine receptor subunit alpha-3-like [Orbicella faveolata]